MPDFVISFEKDKDYRRFVLTHVLTNMTRGMAVVELLEETAPIMKKVVFPETGESKTERGENNIENIVHATAVIHPEQLPLIINSLQNIYDRYLVEKFPGGDKKDGET